MARPWATGDLRTRRDILATQVRAQLEPEHRVIVRGPLVLAGNLSEQELDRWYRDTIAPAMDALARDYFQVPPEHPVTILLFSDEATYREYARRLFHENQVSIYGYYQPTNRTVVINLSAGSGTLVHELTHALVDFDFPSVPIWFNEGLASLHEHCDLQLTPTGPEIVPLVNWRLDILQNALAEGRLQPTWELMQSERLRGREEAILYAHARYFCFFLYEKGVLQDFYQELRSHFGEGLPGNQAAGERSRRGEIVIRQFFPGKTWGQIELEFRTWVMRQQAPETSPDFARRPVTSGAIDVPMGPTLIAAQFRQALADAWCP